MEKEIGLRVTKNINLIDKKIVIDALNVYLGNRNPRNDFNFIKRTEARKEEDYQLNSLFRESDLFCYLVRISDNMNSSEFDSEKTVNAFDAHLGTKSQYCEGINNNMLIRSLGSEELPFHAFKIDYQVIKRALDTLAFKYYIHIHIWYFENQEVKFPEVNKRDLKKLKTLFYNAEEQRNSQTKYKYLRAWRKRYNALNHLRLRIIDIISE